MIIKQKEQIMAIEVAIIMRNRLIVEAKTDNINHPYIQALEV